MRCAWYERPGAASEVLVVGEMPDPAPGPGEVRVALKASAVNPSDANLRAGLRSTAMAFPRVIPNSDGAGVVDALGEGVDPEWLGRRVWLYNGQRGARAFGTAAEYIALDAGLIAELPANTASEEGACLGIPCMTAHVALFCAGPVAGKTILVTGAAGAVGHYAVQLAKRAGARVIGTVSSATKARDAAEAGADCVIDYRRESVAARVRDFTGSEGVDLIVEVDLAANLAVSAEVLRNNGTIATYASRSNEWPGLPFYPLLRKNARVQLILLNNCPLAARQRAQHDIVAWLNEGKARHRVAGAFALRDIAVAHEAVEKGGKRGTVIVRI
jgi:NADPH2:quinone reductase